MLKKMVFPTVLLACALQAATPTPTKEWLKRFFKSAHPTPYHERIYTLEQLYDAEIKKAKKEKDAAAALPHYRSAMELLEKSNKATQEGLKKQALSEKEVKKRKHINNKHLTFVTSKLLPLQRQQIIKKVQESSDSGDYEEYEKETSSLAKKEKKTIVPESKEEQPESLEQLLISTLKPIKQLYSKVKNDIATTGVANPITKGELLYGQLLVLNLAYGLPEVEDAQKILQAAGFSEKSFSELHKNIKKLTKTTAQTLAVIDDEEH